MVGDEAKEVGELAGELFGVGNGVGALGKERREVVVMREDVVSNLGLDVEGVDLEAVDEEPEIGCGEWGRVVEVVGGE